MSYIFTSSNEIAVRVTDTTGIKFKLAKNAPQLIRLLGAAANEEILVIAEDVDFSDALLVAEKLRISHPFLMVILIRVRLEMSQMRQAMSAGISNVILQADGAGLARACQQSILITKEIRRSTTGNPEEIEEQAHVLLVYSAKGGVGKTTLASNIASALAKTQNKRVCLIDFDLQFGDVGVALGLDHAKSISDALPEGRIKNVEHALSLTTNYKPNFDVLLAPLTPLYAEEIGASLAKEIIENLRQSYDLLVIDSPPAFTDVILQAFDLADTYYFVTTSDSPSLKNLALAFDTLKKIGLSVSKCKILVNRFAKKTGVLESEIRDLIVKLTGIKDITFINESKEILRTANSGIPVVYGYPRSKVSKSINSIATQAIGVTANS
jgi:pilus assembly protein CpaE